MVKHKDRVLVNHACALCSHALSLAKYAGQVFRLRMRGSCAHGLCINSLFHGVNVQSNKIKNENPEHVDMLALRLSVCIVS